MNNYDYPMGSDTSDAPWNQVDLPEREIEVTISITLSKTVKIKVNDYDTEVESDEEGKHIVYDYSDCDLYSAVESQVVLPQTNFKDWSVDDYEIILE